MAGTGYPPSLRDRSRRIGPFTLPITSRLGSGECVAMAVERIGSPPPTAGTAGAVDPGVVERNRNVCYKVSSGTGATPCSAGSTAALFRGTSRGRGRPSGTCGQGVGGGSAVLGSCRGASSPTWSRRHARPAPSLPSPSLILPAPRPPRPSSRPVRPRSSTVPGGRRRPSDPGPR